MGIDVRMEWELDRVSLRTMASGSGRPVRGPHPRDISSQTRTPAGEGAAVTAAAGCRIATIMNREVVYARVG